MLTICLGALLVIAGLHGPARGDWKSEWEQTLAAAKKEGRVNLYIGRYGQPQILAEFAKEFPDIKPVSVNGSGNQLSLRILAESRAGKPIADLYSGGANSSYTLLYKARVLAPVPPALILPEVVDPSKWYTGKHAYTDGDRQYIFVYIANPGRSSIAYNTSLINPADFKSHWDLINPKWKGKLGSQPLTETGLGASLQSFYYHPEIGPEWIRRVYSTMDVTFGDRHLLVDWLAKGKLALCIGCRGTEKARSQGLPVADFRRRHVEGGAGRHDRRRVAELDQRRPAPERRESFRQLVSLAPRSDRAAKFERSLRRAAAQFAAHRHFERRADAGEPPRRG
jgi:hypothetical protein